MLAIMVTGTTACCSNSIRGPGTWYVWVRHGVTTMTATVGEGTGEGEGAHVPVTHVNLYG